MTKASWQEEFDGYYDCFPLTHEQAFQIKDLLILNFNQENVKKFIIELRDCCEGAACLIAQPDFKTYKNDRKSIVGTLQKSYNLLDDLRKGKAIKHLSSFTSLYDYNDSEEYFECQEIAASISILLGLLIRKIKRLDDTNIQRSKGRPTADSKEIVFEMTKIWERCFNQKPTTYQDGLFMTVVRIVLEGLKLEYEYPQRKVKEALNKQMTKKE